MPSMAHILIVEDNPANADVASVLVTQAGHTVRLAKTGLDVLRRLLAHERFDLMLLDVLMPEMDGIEVVTTLRETPKHAGVPIIAVTAVTGRRDVQQLRAAGVDEIVTKPYRKAELLAAIDRILLGVADEPEGPEES
jgi:CheY-like chemotaxis protein